MFIVLEGIDGAGKGRQRNEISIELEKHVKQLHSVEFPDHQGVMYRELIKPALLEKTELDGKSMFLAFALDQMLFQSRIQSARGSKSEFFISDGYFTTNLVYNCLTKPYVELAKALKFAEDFSITQADLNIFIDVDPKVAQERKLKEEGHDEGLDANERNLALQYKLRESFLYLIKNNIFGPWEVVPGNGTIEKVKQAIITILIKHKYI